MLIIVSLIGIYSIEIFIQFSDRSPKIKIARELNIDFDTRSKIQVMRDLRKKGIDAQPDWGPNQWTNNSYEIESLGIYPLAGISNVTTIYHNENGYLPIIQTDEHGFNNPAGLHLNSPDIVMLGDSFTAGYSVHPHQNISSLLRKDGLNVLNLGKAGNGSLVELATLIEYAKPLQPKIVLWMYHKSDIHNLKRELESDILKKYLYNDDYSQNLKNKQTKIDTFFRDYLNEIEEEFVRKKNLKTLRQIITLKKIRSIIGLENKKINSNVQKISYYNELNTFKEILLKSKELINSWGGKLYFVYLPSYEWYSTGKKHHAREYVLDTATQINVEIIDIHERFFKKVEDPLNYFPFKMYGHYNELGYFKVAEVISKQINDELSKY